MVIIGDSIAGDVVLKDGDVVLKDGDVMLKDGDAFLALIFANAAAQSNGIGLPNKI